MLSFDTVHAITDHLDLADAVHPTDRLTTTLLLLHRPSRPGAHRVVRALGCLLPDADADADATLPDHLHRLAHTITTAAGTPTTTAVSGTPLLIDDVPDQAYLPAAHSGLTAVLAATTARSAYPTGSTR